MFFIIYLMIGIIYELVLAILKTIDKVKITKIGMIAMVLTILIWPLDVICLLIISRQDKLPEAFEEVIDSMFYVDKEES